MEKTARRIAAPLAAPATPATPATAAADGAAHASTLPTLLRARAEQGTPVRVGIVGAGRFGTTVAAQVGQIPGMRLAAVADVNEANARAAFRAAYAGLEDADLARAAAVGSAADLVERGKPALLDDGTRLVELPLDVVVEATGRPNVSARVIWAALGAGQHVVNVTVESDVLLGAVFRRRADAHGVVYTVADGDQPGCTARLVEWAQSLGYRVVAAGRGTQRHPWDRHGVPEGAFDRYGYAPDLVERRRLNPQMYNSFRDGSKAQIEMTSLANMTGLVPDKRGMHEPSASVEDLPRLFALREDGGVLSDEGVVDLANAVSADGHTLLPNHIAIGIWVVVTTDNPLLQEDLAFYGLPASPDGRRAVLYRPYHLCGTEAPLSIAEAAVLGRPTGTPLPTPVADVVTYAKRALRAGDRLDGSGGETVYGLTERAPIARAERLLPLGLADGVTVNKAIAADSPITWDDVQLDEAAYTLKLRREQDRLW
jgi:predicted homoserine dehydrogenase-like protein